MSGNRLPYTHKLFSILGTFSQKEVRRFRLFFQPGYFHSNEQVALFLEACLHYHPAYKADKTDIFRRYAPGKTYDDLRFRHLSSDGLKIALLFLQYQHFGQDEAVQQSALIGELCERRADSMFRKEWETEKTGLEAAKLSEQTLFRRFMLEKHMGNWVENQRNRSLDPNISGISRSLDAYFLLQKVRLLCMASSFATVSSHIADVSLQEEVLSVVRKQFDVLPPLIRMYYLAYLTLTHPGETESYQQLLAELEQHLHTAGEKEARELIVIARNYGIRKVNQGDNRYFRDLFALYRMELDSGLALENGVMNPFTFKNIVATALQLKETGWAAKFLETYCTSLPKSQQEQVYLFNLSRILFAQGEYKKSRQILVQHTFRELFNQLDARILLIKIYYETADDESMSSTCEAFRNYLQRNPSLAYHRKHYLNFIRYIHKLSNAGPAAKQQKVYQEIRDCDALVDKNWLLEKAAVN